MSTSKSYLPYRLNETQRSLPLSASATTALAEPPDLLFEDGFLSGPVRRSLCQPRRTWTEECHAHLQPFSDPCCALKADRLVSWAHRPPRACACLPSSPAAPPLPLASCAQITRAALPLSKLFKSAAPATWNASPPSLQAGSFLSFRVQTSFLREACSNHSHTKSVSCTVLRLLFLSYLLQLEYQVWDLLWVLTQVWYICHNSPRCLLKTCVLYYKLHYWGIMYE